MNTQRPQPITSDSLANLVADAPPANGVLDVQKAFEWLGDVAAQDVVLGRLAEGHVDAMRILYEAEHAAYPGVYGVWASASGGTGLTATPAEDGWSVNGTMRFASGAGTLDRALVVAAAGTDKVLLDIDAQRPELVIDRDSWPAVGMSRSESYTIAVTDLFVPVKDLVGAPGFYLDRYGFAVGGIGVAATWLGAARGLHTMLLDTFTRREPNPFQQAYLGGIEIAVAAGDAVVHEAIQSIQSGRVETLDRRALVVRSVVEHSVLEVLDLAARAVGPAGLCLDGRLATHIVDLGVYVRQHHGDVDLAHLGSLALADHREK